MRKTIKIPIIILSIVLSILMIAAIIVGISLMVLDGKTKPLLADFSSVYDNEKYSEAVSIDDVPLVTQDISCGYAVIEMLARYWSYDDITEESLFDEYNGVVTSTGKKFASEMNKRFTEYRTTMYKYLDSISLIDKVYDSLHNGIPVPCEWAAKLNDVWTLHYSLIVGMDVANDRITILNPYGIEEKIHLGEFISRMNFEAYEDMPFFIKLGFSFGIFEKNTIFISERI